MRFQEIEPTEANGAAPQYRAEAIEVEERAGPGGKSLLVRAQIMVSHDAGRSWQVVRPFEVEVEKGTTPEWAVRQVEGFLRQLAQQHAASADFLGDVRSGIADLRVSLG